MFLLVLSTLSLYDFLFLVVSVTGVGLLFGCFWSSGGHTAAGDFFRRHHGGALSSFVAVAASTPQIDCPCLVKPTVVPKAFVDVNIKTIESILNIRVPDYPAGYWKTNFYGYENLVNIWCKKFDKEPVIDYFIKQILIKNVQNDLPWFDRCCLSGSAPSSRVPSLDVDFLLSLWLQCSEHLKLFYILVVALFFFALVLFMQFFVLQDALLLFTSVDLVFSIFGVLFALTGFYYQDLFGVVFFFTLITLAACDTAISLGFLVAFSRRFKKNSVTLAALRYSAL